MGVLLLLLLILIVQRRIKYTGRITYRINWCWHRRRIVGKIRMRRRTGMVAHEGWRRLAPLMLVVVVGAIGAGLAHLLG